MTTPIKATVQFKQENGKISANRKESHFRTQITAVDPKDGTENVVLRLYLTDRMAYACIWCKSKTTLWDSAVNGFYTSGGGRAGGYGYHRPSQAAECAIRDAGFNLSQSIGGVGDQAMKDAVEAIAKAITGKKKFFILTAHA